VKLSKIHQYFQKAQLTAQASHDAETKVGAVLINKRTGSVVAEGFNGFVRGANDLQLPKTRPDKYQYMIHAEQNLLTNIIHNNMNVDVRECVLVCTLSPCSLCMRLLFQAGIKEILFRDYYTDFDKHVKMGDLFVDIKKIDRYTLIKLYTLSEEVL